MDEQAIGEVLSTLESTWNEHDMERWGELFTEDVDYVNRAGGIWHGNKTNAEEHKRIHAMLQKQNQKMDWTAKITKIGFLTPEIALVYASWKWPGMVPPSGDQQELFRGTITMVMTKRDDKWLIRALHNSIVTPA